MISLLAFYTLAFRTIKPRDVVNPSRDADDCRSLPNIIWSCLTTIFLCTWVSLHPNVPKPVDETKLNKRQWCAHKLRAFIKDQVFPFVLLLVAPEWILMWALRQRFVVEYMVRTKKVPSRRHGFFIIMGGFHKFSRVKTLKLTLSDPPISDPAPSDPLIWSDIEKKHTDKAIEEEYGEPRHPLDRFDVCRLVDDGRLRLPPEVEIDDKSKSDWIAKALVLLQTLWFVVQCMARRIDHLPLTELEVVTLGYALLNLVIYVIWWDKPQKVARPIRIFCGELLKHNDKQSRIQRRMKRASWFQKLYHVLVGAQDDQVDLRSVEKVPVFYSGNPPQDWPFKLLNLEDFAMVVTAMIGSVFGAIHLLAWSSPFPTRKMLISWRWGSTLMAVAPLPILAWFIAYVFLASLQGVENIFLRVIRNRIIFPLAVLSAILSLSLVPLVYVAGRVITLILAFQTLATLPSEAFQSVQWTNLLPHV